MPTLSELQSRFFVPDVGTGGAFDADSNVETIIDGVAYFRAMANSIELTKTAEDFVYITTWEIDLDWDLQGNVPPIKTLGNLLVEKAALGVDVRIILNGHLVYIDIGEVDFGPIAFPLMPLFVHNYKAAQRLRKIRPAGSPNAPMAGRVLFDWSGANLSGSQHQKSMIIRSEGAMVAYVGGMNLTAKFRDASPHVERPYPKGDKAMWGWHDIGCCVRGEAVRGVWENFTARWTEAATLPNATRVDVVPYFAGQWRHRIVYHDVNPKQTQLPASEVFDDPTASIVTTQSVRVLRSRFTFKRPDPRTLGISGEPWSLPPTDQALTEIFTVYRRAIASAQRYIYIEDQFLDDEIHPERLPDNYSLYGALGDALAANPTLKVILVGSGRADPDDFMLPWNMGYKNRKLTSEIKNDVLGRVPTAQKLNLAVWRLENATVHSKILMIDDQFLAIGSANFQARSMYGVDSELQVAMVTTDDTILDFRTSLWSEHLRILDDPLLQQARDTVRDLDRGLGIWRQGWYPADPDLWFANGNPAGVTGHGALALVGPTEADVNRLAVENREPVDESHGGGRTR